MWGVAYLLVALTCSSLTSEPLLSACHIVTMSLSSRSRSDDDERPMCVGLFVVCLVSGCHVADSDVAPGFIVRRGLGEGSCWLTWAGTNPGQ